MLSTALRILARCWPALLVWFLVGWTIRALVLRVGGYLLNIDENLGLLVLPIGILAMLVAYVAMFLAVRDELSSLQTLDAARTGDVAPTRSRMWGDTVFSTVLPFLLLYVAWNLVREDVVDLYFASTLQENWGANQTVGQITVVAIVILVAAFALRTLLGRLAPRLPRWVGLVTTYLEALWILVGLFVIRDLLRLLGDWLATRRMFAWAVDAWAALREQFSGIALAGDAVAWVWNQFGTLVGLPLAWLALASIVYFGTMPRSARPSRAASTARSRWERMPVWLRRLGTALTSGIVERWHPVALAARLIWRSGPIVLGGYLLGFAVVTAATEWLKIGIFRLIGPHDTNWWAGASDAVGLGVAAIVATLQVALVAATFDRALRSDRAAELFAPAGDAVSAAAEPAAAPSTR